MRSQSARDIIAGKNNKEAFKNSKALAAFTYILMKLGGKGDKHQLIKMMYWLERKYIIETGFPMFYDQAFSLEYGPILSQVLDNMNSCNNETSPWYGHIRFTSPYKIELIKNGDFDELSDYDEELIAETVKKFSDLDFSSRTKLFHLLPEYTQVPEGQREEISYRVILENETDMSQEDIIYALFEIESTKMVP